MYKNYYNIYVLLICIGAFPAQISALPSLSMTDSSICSFHIDDSDIDEKHNVKCDHCTYYFDLEFNKIDKYIFQTNQNISRTEFTHKKIFVNYIFSQNPRSPPLV